MSLGIPAVTIDGGGRGTGSHALDEAFDSTNSWMGSQRARCSGDRACATLMLLIRRD